MEQVYELLTARAAQIHKSVQNGTEPKRAVIAFAGPPGSGKTTCAVEVVRRLNLQHPGAEKFALTLPMDGFHLPRSVLDKLPNGKREEAYARRGVSWTFDAEGVLKLVRTLHDRSKVIFAPSFDHKLKDPVENGISVGPEIEIVILEGNWLLYDEEPWAQISKLVDDTWFVDVAPALARDRVAKRHLKSGIETTMEAAIARAEGNDLLNGDLVRTKLVTPAVRVESVEVDMEVKKQTPSSLTDTVSLEIKQAQ